MRADATTTAPGARAVRVLLVEDNPGDAALIDAALGEVGAGTEVRPWFEVRHLARLGPALALLRDGWAGSGDDAVVLLDLHLPDARGLEGIAAVRAAAPDVPIVMLTGLDDDVVALEALRAGAQDYLVKGRADGDVLARAVRYALERKRTESALARARWMAGIGETALAVRHEVSTPLHWLVANADLLAVVPEEERPAVVADIVAGAREISAVLRRLQELDDPRSVQAGGGQRMLDLKSGG